MARVARKFKSGEFYHVMMQGIGKDYIFKDDNLKGFFLQCVKENKPSYPNIKVLGFCVMNNHVHIIVKAASIDELSKFFRRVNSDYARYYNRVLDRVGYVFRDRFRSETIDTVDGLINCLAYVHYNPVKAGLVKDAAAYRFSSLYNYLSCNEGILDFLEASSHMDISYEGMQNIMFDYEEQKWLEHDDRQHENRFDVLYELIEKFGLNDVSQLNHEFDKKKIVLIAKELHIRTGASYRRISEILDIKREKLRRWLIESNE